MERVILSVGPPQYIWWKTRDLQLSIRASRIFLGPEFTLPYRVCIPDRVASVAICSSQPRHGTLATAHYNALYLPAKQSQIIAGESRKTDPLIMYITRCHLYKASNTPRGTCSMVITPLFHIVEQTTFIRWNGHSSDIVFRHSQVAWYPNDVNQPFVLYIGHIGHLYCCWSNIWGHNRLQY